MASTYLTRTPSSAGNRKTWTYSAWFKIGNVSTGAKRLFTSYDGSTATNQSTISLGGGVDYAMQIYNAPSGSSSINLTTNRLFRDCNAWYHLVVAVDTTQATGSDRVKLYINGVQETSFSVETYGTQNEDFFINSTNLHTIGRRQDNSQYFDGSMSHIHFIDGTAYSPSDFGETDATTGIWKPKTAPSVTYGTNGFFLKFENSGAFGTDSSGNGNTFTVNGTMTQTIDTPSNVFSTLNSLNYSPNTTVFSNGNTTVTTTGDDADNSYACTNLGANKGKWYWEGKQTANVSFSFIGVDTMPNMTESIRNDNNPGNTGVGYRGDGQKRVLGTNSAFGNSYGQNDIIQVALDLDNNFVYFGKNGTWQNSGDPTSGSSGTGGIAITGITGYDTEYLGCIVGDNSSGEGSATWSMNFGNGYFGTTAVSSAQNPDDGIGIFEYSVPTGYKALCTESINAQEYS